MGHGSAQRWPASMGNDDGFHGSESASTVRPDHSQNGGSRANPSGQGHSRSDTGDLSSLSGMTGRFENLNLSHKGRD
ncbi:hypothetical protein M426DRAFT_323681 [Hypoxylon sp. CI-4A]|nr:hypothetical protein M426DRAFT_323681 [Hypoxylon sp. CI-4A]